MSNIRSDGHPTFIITLDDKEDQIQWYYRPVRISDIREHPQYQQLIEDGYEVRERLTVDYVYALPDVELSVVFYRTHYTEKQTKYKDYLNELGFWDELHFINTKGWNFFLLGSKKIKRIKQEWSTKQVEEELFHYVYDVQGMVDEKSIDERVNEMISAVLTRSQQMYEEAARLAERVAQKIADTEIKKREKKTKNVK